MLPVPGRFILLFIMSGKMCWGASVFGSVAKLERHGIANPIIVGSNPTRTSRDYARIDPYGAGVGCNPIVHSGPLGSIPRTGTKVLHR